MEAEISAVRCHSVSATSRPSTPICCLCCQSQHVCTQWYNLQEIFGTSVVQQHDCLSKAGICGHACLQMIRWFINIVVLLWTMQKYSQVMGRIQSHWVVPRQLS